ncbi:hypothetical protein GCM10027275_46970 [Rhabdobacter roseus]|uniref:Uncharacterized protein n=1 Tax=Rhabdobacter roseus TaxID=1655419 RepID=A0A840TU38_9BACT|nr:hypothetical protein [Rhabdobacter roseus]MBB5286425.1 hypothetical protein [Rhabdobacter roseus]
MQRLNSTYPILLTSAFAALVLLLSAYPRFDKIRYFGAATLAVPADTVLAHTVDFRDTVAGSTLYQVLSKEKYPLAYYREIRTGVCFDNKCRLLNVVLYWNPTGRYLGFELPESEYLSKSDHEPFVAEEYQRLHALLADSLSPLSTFSYNEIVPSTTPPNPDVDAVSSATARAVLEYVVPGAAYTTYKLWHLLYGPAQEEVQRLTRQRLSPELLLMMLDSPALGDQIWALNHSRGYLEPSSALRQRVLSFIDPRDYNLAERAINALSPPDLESTSLQEVLLDKFQTGNHSLKKLLLTKLREAPALSTASQQALARQLTTLSGELVTSGLDLYQQQPTLDPAAGRVLSELLENDNAYISKKAYQFFEKVPLQDKLVQKRLGQYRARHGLSGTSR